MNMTGQHCTDAPMRHQRAYESNRQWGQLIGIALALTIPAGAQALVVTPITPHCDGSDLVRPISAVTNKSIVGSGGYTIAFTREDRAARLEAPHPGTTIEVVRCLPPGRLVRLATGKIDRVEQSQYEASVFVPSGVANADASTLTQSLVLQRNLYWQPMQGDFVRVLTPRITARQQVWPRFTFDVGDIFETRSADDVEMMSLSITGRQRLVEAFKQLESYPGRFIVEGVIYGSGHSAKSASEITQMRAGIVANYLAQVFEIPSARIVPRGIGRSLPADGYAFRDVAASGPGQTLVRDAIRIRALPLVEGPSLSQGTVRAAE